MMPIFSVLAAIHNSIRPVLIAQLLPVFFFSIKYIISRVRDYSERLTTQTKILIFVFHLIVLFCFPSTFSQINRN